MDTRTGEEEPPKSTDLDGWRRAIADDRLSVFRLEALAAAFQDLGNRDTQVQHALAKHLSDAILHMLRKHVGINHPDQGWDIIYRTHYLIVTALLSPKSADGRSLRVAFGSRVLFRIKDAIAAEQRERRTPDDAPPEKRPKLGGKKDIGEECGVDIDASAEPTESDEEFAVLDDPDRASPRPIPQEDPLSDEMRNVDEQINVEGILDCVGDPRKRMAFHLFMDGVPYKSKKKSVESIAQALGISERTAREWVKEVRQLLAEHEGVKHLKKLRVGVRS
ncbi:MAG: hypothetical protein WCA89_16185 [Terracidiphilus sp.]|jgi:DNA-directed RNA polymerase specialized sigma24 family protein